jgi:hypothetical protein
MTEPSSGINVMGAGERSRRKIYKIPHNLIDRQNRGHFDTVQYYIPRFYLPSQVAHTVLGIPHRIMYSWCFSLSSKHVRFKMMNVNGIFKGSKDYILVVLSLEL